jgi:hypothetical protein
VVVERLGLVVHAVPRRGADVVAAADELGDARSSSAINIRDAARPGAGFVRAFGCPTRRSTTPARRCCRSGTLTAELDPELVVLDGEGRVAASIIGGCRHDHARRARRGRRRGRVQRWVTGSPTGRVRLDVLAVRWRCRGPGVVLLAVRDPAAAGYLSYATGLSGADLADARRPRAAGCCRLGAVRARLLGGLRALGALSAASALAGRLGATLTSCSAC